MKRTAPTSCPRQAHQQRLCDCGACVNSTKLIVSRGRARALKKGRGAGGVSASTVFTPFYAAGLALPPEASGEAAEPLAQPLWHERTHYKVPRPRLYSWQGASAPLVSEEWQTPGHTLCLVQVQEAAKAPEMTGCQAARKTRCGSILLNWPNHWLTCGFLKKGLLWGKGADLGFPPNSLPTCGSSFEKPPRGKQT